MIRRLFHTFATRLGAALLNFAVVLLTARYLGAAGRGQVSLFVTDVALLMLFSGLLGGAGLMYLAARRNLWQLLLPALAWAALVCAAGTAVVGLWRQPGTPYLGHLLPISVLQAFFATTSSVLLARRREPAFNLLNLAQAVLLAGLLWAGLAATLPGSRSVAAYWWASYPAYGLPLLASLLLLYRAVPEGWPGRRGWGATLRELARHGRSAHFSSILAFLNYRLGYYFVAAWVGPGAVGVLSVGTALAEAVWLIPRSAAQVQYLDVLHAPDPKAAAEATARTIRLTLLATGAAVLVLAALPATALAAIFGPEFGAARPIILLLAPGTLAISCTMLTSSYFSGLARYRVNNVAQTGGLVVTLLGGLLLIPRYGPQGAALATTGSYLASAGYQLWQFTRTTGLPLRHLLPR